MQLPVGGLQDWIMIKNYRHICFLTIAMAFAVMNARGQGSLTVQNGSQIIVQSGGSVTLNGNLTIDNGGAITNGGTVTITRNSATNADFTDNNTTTQNYGTGKFVLSGTAGSQNIRGWTFYDLEINNSSGVYLSSDITVGNNLNMLNGPLVINGNALTLNGSYTGTAKLKGSSGSSFTIGGNAGTVYFDQTDSASRSLNNLQLSSGTATLGNAVQVYGLLGLTSSTLHMNGQSVVLKSTGTGADSTARVGNLTGSTVDGATNVTVERYITSPRRGWHLLSAQAVTGSQTIKQAWQENGGAVVAGQGTLITSNLYNGSNGFDQSSLSSSILTHNQGGLSGPSFNYGLANTNATAISSYPGYMLFVRGDRNYTPANSPSTSPTVLRTNGTLTQGNQSAFISSTGTGRTLVANPYASPIDMENIFSGTTNLAQDMYVWDISLAGSYGVGGYRLVERVGAGTYQQTPVTLGGSPTADANARYIHSGQAFFLRTVGTAGTTNATVTFTEADKASVVSVVNPIVNDFREQQLFVNLVNIAPDNSDVLTDGLRIRYDNNYSSGIGDDVQKIGNFTENISSFRENKKLIVEKRPMISANDTIFLNMGNMAVRNYRFKLGTFNFNQPGVTAFLEDNWLTSSTPIDLSGTINTVAFNVSSNPASASADRFRIVFKPGAPLPVSYISLNAFPQSASVKLDWKVTAEHNMSNYSVERSDDGQRFSIITRKAATGNNNADMNYSWNDDQPLPGTGYYRIQGVSINGDLKYSDIVKVQFGKIVPSITITPNPVTGQEMRLQFSNMEKGTYLLRLFNANGQELMKRTFEHRGGTGINTIELVSLAAGQYNLEIRQPSGDKMTKTLFITQ